MAKLNNVKKAAKDQGPCLKCATPISKGDSYKWFAPFRSWKRIYCSSCPVMASDMCTNQSQPVLAAKEEVDRVIAHWVSNEVEHEQTCDIQSTIENLTSTIEDVCGEMEEQCTDESGNERGGYMEQVREKMEELQDWQNELECLDIEQSTFDDMIQEDNDAGSMAEAIENAKELLQSEIQDVLDNCPVS